MGEPITTSLAIAGGSAVLGSQQQKKIKKAQKGQKANLLDLQGQMFSNLDPALANQENYIKQANKASEGGFQSAIDDANRVETEGVKGAKDFFKQASGGVDANLASRGLLGSSQGANMRLGAARGASRALTDAQVAASRLRTGAQLGLGAAKAQGLNNLGTFEAYRANSRNSILSGLWDYVAGQQFQAQSPNLANFAQLATMFGNGTGGGGGSAPAPTSYPSQGSEHNWHALFGGS